MDSESIPSIEALPQTDQTSTSNTLEVENSQNNNEFKHQPQVNPHHETEMFKYLTNVDEYFNQKLNKKLDHESFNVFSIISSDDEDRKHFSSILSEIKDKKESKEICKLELNTRENRGIACLLGLAICDALGASTEFIPFEKKRRDLIAYDFMDIEKQIKNRVLSPRHGRIGIWTDDCSMALCMADSLLLNNHKFEPINMRFMFHMWLDHGLNNGGRSRSIGLGGNISISMYEFTKERNEYTEESDRFNNGNGSLMRLAPVPLNYLDNENSAMDISGKSSRTTHNGDEAKECSRLMALILVRLINRENEENWKVIIEKACEHFAENICEIDSVKYLALSQQEPLELYEKQAEVYGNRFKNFNKSIQDRNWNWKDENFTYSKCRTYQQPGYIGSYCMDALSMALHTVWYSHSFQEVALFNANIGGDCDTVGAIAGQIAGAIYGIDDYMMHLYSQMEDAKEKRYEVFLKAYKIVNQKSI